MSDLGGRSIRPGGVFEEAAGNRLQTNSSEVLLPVD